MPTQDIGVIGCGVMGQNLALNIERRGSSVAVYDKKPAKVREYLAGRAAGRRMSVVEAPKDLARAVRRPRRILMVIPAGEAVDQCVEELLPCLDPGDVLIDGGNSHFADTNRRAERLDRGGLHWIGAGISGGAEGALNGPSIMAGGSRAGWEEVEPILKAVAAKTEDGFICCDRVGDGGAGHFVKMVHNGIEYGEMQMICEAYHLMKQGLDMSPDQVAEVFDTWNQGGLCCYLLQAARDVLKLRDRDGAHLVEKIVDRVGRTGTGGWTAATAIDAGSPFTAVASALSVRFLSSFGTERREAVAVFSGPSTRYERDTKDLLDDLEQSLFASKIVNHAQGFRLMRAGEKYGWDFDCGAIASLWRAGCIIRSTLLERIKEAFDRNPGLGDLLHDHFVADRVAAVQSGWRRVVAVGVRLGVPLPAITSALTYFDCFRSGNLPTNLLQGMRDYFGAHGYERVDRPQGQLFHCDWTGDGSESEVG